MKIKRKDVEDALQNIFEGLSKLRPYLPHEDMDDVWDAASSFTNVALLALTGNTEEIEVDRKALMDALIEFENNADELVGRVEDVKELLESLEKFKALFPEEKPASTEEKTSEPTETATEEKEKTPEKEGESS